MFVLIFLSSIHSNSYAEGKEKGRSMMRRGYWCDIVCSPFVPVGLDCETPNDHAEELFGT